MGHRVMPKFPDGYGPRQGLEGPFRYPNGRILYYSPGDGQYWDPATDWFVPEHEVAELQTSIFQRLAG